MFATALLLALSAQAPQTSAQAATQPQANAAGSPVVIVGCLQSAKAEGRDQFTLTAADTNRAAGQVKTLTYILVPKNPADLSSNVGKRVEVTGTESRAATEAAEADTTRSTQQPTGTSGVTPTVETKTRADVVVRQVNVTSVKPLTGDCRVP
jgi:hypothetical protein